MAPVYERFRPEVAGRKIVIDAMACVVNPLAPLVTPMGSRPRPLHDLAHESHDQFWEKECAERPNALGCRLFDD